MEDSGISPYGFQKVKASYAAILSEDGELRDIISLAELNNKRPQIFLTPTSLKSSSIAASPVCDNFDYIFGVFGENGSQEISEVKFACAKKLHLKMFETAESREAIAIRQFFQKWDPKEAWKHPAILKSYSGKGKAFNGNVVFRLPGQAKYFHQSEEILNLWLAYNEDKRIDEDAYTAQCSISGDIGPISRLHVKLSGIDGASTMGASLVCFNKDADSSYGMEQSRNSAVSELVTFKYGTALQHLLSSQQQRIVIGDATTVFWAGRSEKVYTDIMKGMLSPSDEEDIELTSEDKPTQDAIQAALRDGSKGITNNPDIDGDVKFYILGLSPNAGRTSVRYFYQSNIASFCDRIWQHYEDIRIHGGVKGRENIKIGSLLYATISSKSKDKKVNPLLGGAVMRAILTGGMYPLVLLNQTIMRVKAEQMVNQPRAAIIKGFLNRENRILMKKEELSMYLNEQSKNQAYVLGRAFAILEMIQRKALGDDLNVTIKDKYFASACSNPSLVFPSLLKLTQHHLAKIEGSYWNIQLGECLGLLEEESFPKTLNMENQGRFILGYYQQNQKHYEKKIIKEAN
jgi:CRISPR-associated protein Csd1